MENRLLSAVTSRPAPEPILPPTQWYWDSFPGVKQLGYDVDHSPQSRAEVKDDWSHTSTPLMSYMAPTGILPLPLRVPLQMEVNDQFYSPTAFYVHGTETISLVSAFQSDIPLLFSFISINKDNPFMLWERREMYTNCWCTNLTKRGHSEEPGVYDTVLCK